MEINFQTIKGQDVIEKCFVAIKKLNEAENTLTNRIESMKSQLRDKVESEITKEAA